MIKSMANTLNNLEQMISSQSEVHKISEKFHSGMDKAKDFRKIFDSNVDKGKNSYSIKDIRDSLPSKKNTIASNEFKKFVKKASEEANIEASLDLTLAKDINEIISQLKEAVEDATEAVENITEIEESSEEISENSGEIIDSMLESTEAQQEIVEQLAFNENIFKNQVQTNSLDNIENLSDLNLNEIEFNNNDIIEFVENTLEESNITQKTDNLSNIDLENLLDEEIVKDLKIESISAETDFSGESDLMQNQTPEEHAIKTMINEDVEVFDLKITSAQKTQGVNTAQPKAVDVNPSKILDQISKQLDGLQSNSKVNIILNPESLGKVNIQLLSSKEGLTAQFVVTTQDAKDLLTKGIDGLRESLLSHGVGVDNISIKVNENQKSEYQQDWTEQENSENNRREQEHQKKDKDKNLFEKMMAQIEDNENGNV